VRRTLDINKINKKNISINSERQEGVQSIRRTIDLLRMVAKYNNPGVNLSKIARKVGLPTTTVHRILAVLVEEGLVIFDPGSKLYRLGFEIYTLGAKAQQFSLRERCHAALERIAETTQDTTYLVIRSGNDAMCIDRVVGKFPIQVLTFEVGGSRPLGIGAGSMAILASLPDEQVDAIIKANRSRYPNYADKAAEDVMKSITQSRKLGYGLSDRVVNSEMVGVGVTVKNSEGEVVAAISVAGIVNRMGPARCEEIVKIIKSEIKSVNFSSNYIPPKQ
jgi:DNA-binding IclR family transcriptional regulator